LRDIITGLIIPIILTWFRTFSLSKIITFQSKLFSWLFICINKKRIWRLWSCLHLFILLLILPNWVIFYLLLTGYKIMCCRLIISLGLLLKSSLNIWICRSWFLYTWWCSWKIV